MKRLSMNMDYIIKLIVHNCDIKIVFGDYTIKSSEAKFLYFAQSKSWEDDHSEDTVSFTGISVYSLMKIPDWKGYSLVRLSVIEVETESGHERYIEANLTSYIPDGNLQLQGCVSKFCLVDEDPDLLPSNVFQIRVKN